jgi:hypothetical protein
LAEHIAPEKYLLGGDSILHYATVEKVHSSIGVLSKTRIVCDHANGSTGGVQLFEQVHDCFTIA